MSILRLRTIKITKLDPQQSNSIVVIDQLATIYTPRRNWYKVHSLNLVDPLTWPRKYHNLASKNQKISYFRPKYEQHDIFDGVGDSTIMDGIAHGIRDETLDRTIYCTMNGTVDGTKRTLKYITVGTVKWRWTMDDILDGTAKGNKGGTMDGTVDGI